MKRILTLVLIALCFSPTFAQQEKDWTSKATITIKAGVGGTGFTSSVEQAKSTVAFRIGGSADIPLSHKVGLQPSLFYSHRGTTIHEPVRQSCRLDYVDLPIMFCFYDVIHKGNAYGLPEGPIMRWKIGPYVGYKLNGEIRNAAAPTRKVDFGGSGGMDVILNRISFSGDLQMGIIPVCKDYNGHSLRNMSLILSIGYRL